MNKKNLFFILALFIQIQQTYAQTDTTWKFVKEKQGIKIYKRKVENFPIEELMGTYIANTGLSGIVSLIKDSPNHKNWMYGNLGTKLLKAPNNFEWYYYSQTDIPWPASDRDAITHTLLSQDSTSYIITVKVRGIPDYLPEKEGFVRVPYFKSSWEFIPLEKNKTLIKLRILTDAGGSIPAWIINLFQDKGPMHTLSAMREQLKKEKYRKIKLPYIKEKY